MRPGPLVRVLRRGIQNGVFPRARARRPRRAASTSYALAAPGRPRVVRTEPKPRPPAAAIGCATIAAVEPVAFRARPWQECERLCPELRSFGAEPSEDAAVTDRQPTQIGALI